MNSVNTEQEEFWVGKFGDEYIKRNQDKIWHSSNLNLFSKIISRTQNVQSIAEYGCNIGLNLRALEQLRPQCQLHGIEINKMAIDELKLRQSLVNVHHRSILERIDLKVDFSFTKGVLIHIHPNDLVKVYDNLYRNSLRYIMVAEYYDPNPFQLIIASDNKMFKRDFAGDLLTGMKI